jgi:hypothetical protein
VVALWAVWVLAELVGAVVERAGVVLERAGVEAVAGRVGVDRTGGAAER